MQLANDVHLLNLTETQRNSKLLSIFSKALYWSFKRSSYRIYTVECKTRNNKEEESAVSARIKLSVHVLQLKKAPLDQNLYFPAPIIKLFQQCLF